ncbi:MAG: InlB B-repeat-containing protein, partial [Actinomycetia bacterium]|nr:InlB B-repeat-containing protein [Actinomycetes bacterium]
AYANSASVLNLTATQGATVTLYAQWALADNTLYKVTHYKVDSQGNAVAADTDTLSGTTGDLTAAATPKSYVGYSYQSGYDRNGNTEVIRATIAADGSTLLRLYYTADQVTLNLDRNTTDPGSKDGAVTTKLVTFAEKVGTLPAGPTRLGYSFLGWATTASASAPDITADSVVDWTAPRTLYAVWQPKTYTVIYDTNGGTPAHINAKDVIWTDSGLTASAPTRAGYAFAGWNVTANGTGTNVRADAQFRDLAANDAVASITLRAQWTALKGDDTGSQETTKPPVTPVKPGNTTAEPKRLASLALPDTGEVVSVSIPLLMLAGALLILLIACSRRDEEREGE